MYVVGQSVRLEKASPTALSAVSAQSHSDASCGVLVFAADDCCRAPHSTAGLRAALQVWLI